MQCDAYFFLLKMECITSNIYSLSQSIAESPNVLMLNISFNSFLCLFLDIKLYLHITLISCCCSLEPLCRTQMR